MAALHFSAEQLPQDCLDTEQIGVSPNEFAQFVDHRAADFRHGVGVGAIYRPLHRLGDDLQILWALCRSRLVLKPKVS